MKLYYNTNGFAHHRLEDIVPILAELGYDGIALTPDVMHLDGGRAPAEAISRFREYSAAHGLGITIESGARFLLDPRRKHQPNLMSESGHELRAAFYREMIDLAVALGAPLMSLWSGAPNGEGSLETLARRLVPVLAYGRERGVTVALEPEPGMFVERLEQYEALRALLAPREPIALTIDVGHLAASERPPFAEHLVAHGATLAAVHLDDSPEGLHEHRMIGDGALDWPALRTALSAIGFQGPAIVELSRHSHDAVRAARTAIERLRAHGF